MSSSHPDLTSFKALSFDCYGTLIDWESGALNTLRLVTSQLPSDHRYNTDPPRDALLRVHSIANDLERTHPTLPYNELLAEAITKFAAEIDLPLADSIAEPFGNSPGTWAAFSDTIEGLQRLAKYYKLIILSNVDNANIAATVDRQLSPVKFDAVYTAQDIGSYKPNHANFQYLFGHARQYLNVDVQKGHLLHVARSLTADHVPAKAVGLRSVWISRGGENKEREGVGGSLEELKGQVAFEWRFDTIGTFADEVERQMAAKNM
ncbi:HAD-like domain-containing protein [Xylariaceae sp. FL0016]|nr:HAD-like domain-containing protein [Xylariaceae sp. FL0016]